jgi:hypothetical protein
MPNNLILSESVPDPINYVGNTYAADRTNQANYPRLVK